MKLDGKVCLVTGASSGIGEATAIALADRGARLVLAARREDRIAALADRLSDATGNEALACRCDVTARADLDRVVAAARERFGPPDVLVNNAGIMPLAPIAACPLDDWDRMVDVNVKGVLYAVGAILPAFLERGRGHIVNVSSVAGRVVFPAGGVYCATKHFVHAFSEGLRGELSTRNVRVTTIAPGYVATELQDSIRDERTRSSLLAMYADKEVLQPSDIARAVVWALEQPDHVSVNEILVRPTQQER